MITYLKKADPRVEMENRELQDTVRAMLARIEAEGVDAVEAYAQHLDGWQGTVVLSKEARTKAAFDISEETKAHIRAAHDLIKRFALAQKATLQDCEIELLPGHFAGQKQIPVNAAGCYVPGGRYAHIASALMTITTAKVAGVPHVTACSPPKGAVGLPAALIYAMDLAGADLILVMGGVQGIAAMAHGYYGPEADILVGPGNAYVAEAKRQLFGSVGIDMIAGPTDSLVIADDTADPQRVALDLVSQAEHGPDSPVWLVTNALGLAQEVMRLVPQLALTLPEPNASTAQLAWQRFGEVVLCETVEEMAQVSDRYAPEHLHVMARDLDRWLERLTNYGSLFLGAGTTVAMGDKASGPNHVLPTSGAARYTGGLSVAKFTKTVTWQRSKGQGAEQVAQVAAAISRLEGMEGHARACDLRATAVDMPLAQISASDQL